MEAERRDGLSADVMLKQGLVGDPFASIWLQNKVNVEDDIVMQHNSYGFVNEQTKWPGEGVHGSFYWIGRDKICQQIKLGLIRRLLYLGGIVVFRGMVFSF